MKIQTASYEDAGAVTNELATISKQSWKTVFVLIRLALLWAVVVLRTTEYNRVMKSSTRDTNLFHDSDVTLSFLYYTVKDNF